MKSKKIRMCSVSMLYIFIMGLVFNFMVITKVNAQSISFTALDKSNVSMQNKYGIKGVLISTKIYSDCKVVVTSMGIYIIKDGKATPYTKYQPSETSSISRSQNNVFVTPVSITDNTQTNIPVYSTAQIDLNTGILSSINQFSKYLGDYGYYEIENASVGSDNNQWFSAITASDNSTYYRLFRVSKDGTSKVINQYNQRDPGHYDEVFSNIKQDSSNNGYYTVFQNNQDNIANNIYKLERVNSDNTVNSFSFTDRVTDYVVSDSGDIWSIVGTKQLVHKAKSGQTISTSPLTMGKSITKDSSNNIYVLDDNTLKKVENNTVKTAVALGDFEGKAKSISMIDENSYVLNNDNSIVVSTNAHPEYIVVDSYVDEQPVVVKDNLGNVFMVSQNNYNSDEIYTKILKINTDGTQEFSKIEELQGDLSKVRAYNGELYFASYDDIIYKIKGEHKEVYQQATGIGTMEIDNLGAIYWVNYDQDKMVKINQDKTKINYDLSGIKAESNGSSYWLRNILVDKYNNTFLIANMNYTQPSVFKVGNTPIVAKVDTTSIEVGGSGLINVFLDKNKELNVMPSKSSKDYKINSNLTFTENTNFTGDYALYNVQKMIKDSKGNLIAEGYGTIFIKSSTDSKFVEQANSAMGIPSNTGISNIEIDSLGRLYLATYQQIFVSSPISFNFNSVKEDTNRDGVVNIVDLASASSNYNTKSSSANWSDIIGCDVNADKIIDLYDLVKISKYMK